MNPLFKDMTPKMPVLAVQSLTARNALGFAQSAEGQINNLIRSGTAGLKDSVSSLNANTTANINSLNTALTNMSKRIDELDTKIQDSDITALQSSLSELTRRMTRIEEMYEGFHGSLPPLDRY